MWSFLAKMENQGLCYLSPIKMRLVEWNKNSCNSVGRWFGICHTLSTMISATESFFDNWMMGNLGAQANGLTIANYPSAIPLKKGGQRSEPIPNTRTAPRIPWIPDRRTSEIACSKPIGPKRICNDGWQCQIQWAGFLKLLYPMQAQTSLRFW